jgi:hypothetical protein
MNIVGQKNISTNQEFEECAKKCPKYDFDMEKYLKGQLLLKDTCVPYSIDEQSDSEMVTCNGSKEYKIVISRCGDLLWKLRVKTVNGTCIKDGDLSMIIGGSKSSIKITPYLVRNSCSTESDIVEVELFGGKGIPLISLCYSEIHIISSIGHIKVDGYYMDLVGRHRKTLAQSSSVWSEGTFGAGVYRPS